MTNTVVARVEAMARKQKQPLIVGGVPLFEWCPNIPFEDLDEDPNEDSVFIDNNDVNDDDPSDVNDSKSEESGKDYDPDDEDYDDNDVKEDHIDCRSVKSFTYINTKVMLQKMVNFSMHRVIRAYFCVPWCQDASSFFLPIQTWHKTSRVLKPLAVS